MEFTFDGVEYNKATGGGFSQGSHCPKPCKSFMDPRIYTYKITFEEIPHWYWGVHKEKSYKDGYLGSPVTHKWMWNFYTPYLQVCEEFPYTDEGWEKALQIENKLILFDLNNPLCLNEASGAVRSLEICRIGGIRGAAAIHREKDPLGRSIQGIKNGRNLPPGTAEKLHGTKNEEGKSVNAIKGALAIHSVRLPNGKSKIATGNGNSMSSQQWECLVTGKVCNPGGLTRWQNSRGIDVSLRRRVK